jgi:Flp pilus assembly protein TadG
VSPRARRPGERGQASVELVAAVPVMLLLGLVSLQLLAVGYAAVLAGGAAEAGALALAAGGEPQEGARAALPGWSRSRARVSADTDSVEVRLRPPSPLPAVSRRFEVTAEAAVALP